MHSNKPTPIYRDLVLVGGGHSHALALKMLAMPKLPGVQITLISDSSYAPYSGMLHGYVSGLYTFEESHIDLRRLAKWADCRFIQAKVKGLDLVNHRVELEGRSAVRFDFLSLNIGSTPPQSSIKGALEFSVGIKPVANFDRHWKSFLQRAEQESNLCISLIGGGAAGVEMALAMNQSLKQLNRGHRLQLLSRDPCLLNRTTKLASEIAKRALLEAGVEVTLGKEVLAIEAKAIRTSEQHHPSDFTVLTTGAAPAPWIRASGLATDEVGFINVNRYLQSVSHPNVFAAGDIATIQNQIRPKAGVFAVRQASYLADNLRAITQSTALKSYSPQRDFLVLVSCADSTAIALRNRLAFRSKWLFWLKDYIDRKFMRKFSELIPQMEDSTEDSDNPIQELRELSTQAQMRCLGCAAKIGPSILTKALEQLREHLGTHAAAIVPNHETEDVAVLNVSAGTSLLQTLDYFPALVNDPFLFGQIAANHAFSDIFAKGATPKSCLSLIIAPHAADKITQENIFQMLAGVSSQLLEFSAQLIGGHTAEGEQLAIGLLCNGEIEKGLMIPKRGLKPGEVLVLTKPLGIGTLFAAEMRLKARSSWIQAALVSMQQSNQRASEILSKYRPSAMTDVTGFGLLGHLAEMLPGKGIEVELNLDSLPALDGALETISNGILSTLYSQNLTRASLVTDIDKTVSDPRVRLLFDPQTSGGLLAAMSQEQAEKAVTEFESSGLETLSIVGKVRSIQENPSTIQIRKTSLKNNT